jgi:hypothetical protein
MFAPPLLLSLLAAAHPAAQQDTLGPFADEGTRTLVEHAMARHRVQDSLGRDYTAKIRYRLSVSLGRRKWAQPPAAAVEEQEGTVAWEYPNNLRADITGSRFKARNPSWRMQSTFESPWFVPRGLGDSVRVFGNDFPEQAAIHPLSAGGPEYYRYQSGDTITISTPRGQLLRLVGVQVTPRRVAGSLTAGRLWIELGSAEVVRFSFRYVGTELWVSPEGTTAKDSADARKGNKWANRILTVDADLEYALQENRYWMPYRQVLSGRVQLPMISDLVIPFEAVTTFDDYVINSGRTVVFELPPLDTTNLPRTAKERWRAERDSMTAERRDSLSPRVRTGYLSGGRFEIRRAPRDSLRSYAWNDSLSLDQSDEDNRRIRETQAELARLAEKLDHDLTGMQVAGLSYERLADVYRFNRVQGNSLGVGYQLKVPSLDFTNLYGNARYGFADGRLMMRIAAVRDAPDGRLTVAGYRELMDEDPFSRGLSFGSSFRSLVFARDEADYYEGIGGGMRWERPLSVGLDLTLGARVEHQRSVATAAKSGLNDLLGGNGEFPPNPEIAGGTYGALSAQLDGVTPHGRWFVAGEGLTGDGQTSGRFYGQLREFVGGATGVALKLSGGIGTGPALPQMEFRAGGLATVRGFDYGLQRGRSLWSMQADWSPVRWDVRPVFFGDAGQSGDPNDLAHRKVLIGAGVGVSALSGLVRAQLSFPFAGLDRQPTSSDLRFDIVFGAVR